MKNQYSTTLHYPQKSNQNLYTGKGWKNWLSPSVFVLRITLYSKFDFRGYVLVVQGVCGIRVVLVFGRKEYCSWDEFIIMMLIYYLCSYW